MNKKDTLDSIKKEIASSGSRIISNIDDPKRFIIAYHNKYAPIWNLVDFDNLVDLKEWLRRERLTIGGGCLIMDLETNKEIKCNWIPSLEYIK